MGGPFTIRRIAAACLACGLVLGSSSLHGQRQALVSAFDTAWRILRANYVAETAADVDWDALRAELRPRAEAAASADELRGIIREMLTRVGQSHFAILPAPVAAAFGESHLRADAIGSLGMAVSPLGDRLVVTRVEASGPAAAAGVAPGWVLSRVDSSDVAKALADGGDAPPHVRAFQRWALGAALLRGPAGSPVVLQFLDGADHPVTRRIVREAERGEPVSLGHLPTQFARLDARRVMRSGRSAGVIRFNVWMTAVARAFDEAIDRQRDVDGLVIDLRGNPGGVLTMIMGISGHFVDRPIPLGTIRTRDSELKLVANPRLAAADGRAVRPFAGPVAILVDSGTYSASEIFSAGMQAIGRARVFGSRTAGGALPAVLERLPGGDVLQYAIGDFVTASGRRIEGVGVVPDVAVAPTRADLLAGRDPVLEAALDWIVEERR